MDQLPIETTTYSMSADAPAKPDRRADERHVTLFRVGSIFLDRKRELCLVKNISGGGALIRAYCTLADGQPLDIELKEGQPIRGRVNWIRGADAGIEFDDHVDVLDLLSSSAGEPRPRMPRVEISCIGFVREGATTHRATVQNVSQGGISIETANQLTVGADVTASLPGLPPQKGLVRWGNQGRYGISFNAVLPLPALVQWLHAQASAA